jgi:Uma2 family endonuclease
VFPAPTDVKLSAEDVVQPDLLVVCDKTQLRETHVEGPPALVVEILSPSTVSFDRVRKMRLYARFGVKEVWLITPYPWFAEVYVLDGASYRLAQGFEKTDTLTSVIFPDLRIALEKVFDYEIPPHEQVQMVREGRPPYGAKP